MVLENTYTDKAIPPKKTKTMSVSVQVERDYLSYYVSVK